MSTEQLTPSQEEEKIIEEKVYIGNVDFSLTKEELDEFLTGYLVESTEIPKKTTRRKGEEVEVGAGHAFATFKSVDEAKRATLELNNKEFKGRKVYTRQALPDSLRPRRPKVAKKPKQSAAKKTSNEESSGSGSAASTTTAAASTDAATSSDESTKKPKSQRKPRKPKSKVAKVPLSEGEASKDTVFINNLDFEVTETELKEFFKEFEPVWVDIPKKIIPGHIYKTLKRQNVPIRGRGIGFVRFGSEEQQKAAVENKNGKELRGRAVTVSIAIDSIVKPTSEVEGEVQPTEA